MECVLFYKGKSIVLQDAVADTGSAVMVPNKEKATSLGIMGKDLEESKATLVDAGGNKLEILGTAQVKLALLDKRMADVRVHIIEKANYSCLIGINELKNLSIIDDCWPQVCRKK